MAAVASIGLFGLNAKLTETMNFALAGSACVGLGVVMYILRTIDIPMDWNVQRHWRLFAAVVSFLGAIVGLAGFHEIGAVLILSGMLYVIAW